MIKGINNSVIEVSDIGNKYYNRAILFLRPEYANTQKNLLEKEARKILKNMDTPSKLKTQHLTVQWFVQMGVSALLGAVFLMCMQLLIK